MSGANSHDILIITGSDRPVRTPDAICEGCGRRGTVGRASRQDASGGMWFESATWHGVIDFVQKLTDQARNYRDPPSPETLARFAAAIRAGASEKVGPMPAEVRAFLAEFGRDSPDEPAR